MDIKREALELHRKNRGKIQLCGKVRIKDSNDLSLVYTPGVAEPCKEIRKDDSLVYQYTNKGNMVAIVTDGSSVLGLGNIGSKASMPVMEGKALLFKELANIDAFPICLESQDKEDIIFTVKQISPTFGGINLEDVLAFPGVLKGALDVRSREINEEMMLEAAFTLANQVPDSQLKVEKILPSIFNKDLVDKIAISVAKKAIDMGVSRI